jgi:hypothetical protein
MDLPNPLYGAIAITVAAELELFGAEFFLYIFLQGAFNAWFTQRVIFHEVEGT